MTYEKYVLLTQLCFLFWVMYTLVLYYSVSSIREYKTSLKIVCSASISLLLTIVLHVLTSLLVWVSS